MRPLAIVGIALIALGAFVMLRGASFTRRDEVAKIGDVKITADKKEAIPSWAGGIAIIAGIAVIFAARQQRA